MRASAADTPDPFKYMVQGDLTVSAESKVVSGLAAEFQQQLAGFQQQGFVKSDSKGLSSHLLLRGGELTANGNVVSVNEYRNLRE